MTSFATTEKANIVRNFFFYAGILCELIVSFSGYLFGGYKESLIILVGMACFAMKILMSMDIKKDIPLLLIAGIYGLVCYKYQGSALVLRLLLILIAGRDQDARKVVKVFFFGTLATMLVAAVLAYLGVYGSVTITDRFKRYDDEVRYAFGFLHPNSFAFFVFRTMMFGIYAYFDRLKWWMLIIIGLVYAGLIHLSESTIAMAVGLLLVVLVILAKLIKHKFYEVIIYYAGTLGMLMIIAFSYVAMVCFDPKFGDDGYAIGFWQTINQNYVTGRFTSANLAFLNNQMTPFGMYKGAQLTEIGFVDSLYYQGYVFMALYVILLLVLYRKMYKSGNVTGMIIVAMSTLHSFAESYLVYVNKNIVLMLGIGCLLNFCAQKKVGLKQE